MSIKIVKHYFHGLGKIYHCLTLLVTLFNISYYEQIKSHRIFWKPGQGRQGAGHQPAGGLSLAGPHPAASGGARRKGERWETAVGHQAVSPIPSVHPVRQRHVAGQTCGLIWDGEHELFGPDTDWRLCPAPVS